MCEVSAGGSDDPTNLIALCSFCHDLYHRGTIKAESIYVYKSMLVAITRAFDVEAIDRLLFLESCRKISWLFLGMVCFTSQG